MGLSPRASCPVGLAGRSRGKQSWWAKTLREAHAGGERAGFDDDVADRSAVAENPVPVAQCPIDRGAAIEADVEPLVKPAHQGRGELAPLADLAAVEHQPAAAAAPAECLEFERGTALALRHCWADQRVNRPYPL